MRSGQSATVAQASDLERVVAFLVEIGLECHWKPGARGFLEGVEVVAGALLVDPKAPPSNLLHETGHCALLPPEIRAMASGDFDECMPALFAGITDSRPDSPELRAAMASSDPEATAWAWAAGVHLGLAPEVIIGEMEYDGDGATVRAMLQMGRYAGIHGLAHGGYCATAPGKLAELRGLPVYPRLATWTHMGFSASEDDERSDRLMHERT